MKQTILLIFILALQLPLLAQEESKKYDIPTDPNTGLITFRDVVSEEGEKLDLFNRASEWLHSYYKNPIYVTKRRDASSGIIKGKHQFNLVGYDKDGNKLERGTIFYSFTIEAKNGRYRYTVDNFLLRQASRYPIENWLNKDDPSYNPMWDEYLQQIAKFVHEDFAPSLKEKMKPKIVVEEEEW